MVAKIFIFCLIMSATLFFTMPLQAQNNQTCRRFYSDENDTASCQRILKTDSGKNWEVSTQCSALTKGLKNTCCCLKQTDSKYILIGSLVVAFGLITGYFLFIKSRQEN